MNVKKGLVQATDPRLPDVVARLKGGASLISESKVLGYSHNSVLRAALRGLLGKDGYDALMTGRQGRSKGRMKRSTSSVQRKKPVPATSPRQKERTRSPVTISTERSETSRGVSFGSVPAPED